MQIYYQLKYVDQIFVRLVVKMMIDVTDVVLPRGVGKEVVVIAAASVYVTGVFVINKAV